MKDSVQSVIESLQEAFKTATDSSFEEILHVLNDHLFELIKETDFFEESMRNKCASINSFLSEVIEDK